MGYQFHVWSLLLVTLATLSSAMPVPSPVPVPQVLPGQIPSHLATHPALSSITQGRESALIQFAYNTQNRRGPNPSPLVLQNNQEQNLQLVNQFNTLRKGGQQAFLAGGAAPLNPGVPPSIAGQQQQNQNPELRAFAEIQKYKNGGSSAAAQAAAPQGAPGGQNNYAPVALTTAEASHYGFHNNQNGLPGGAHEDDHEGEDIKKLKSILNLASGGRPVQGSFGAGGNFFNLFSSNEHHHCIHTSIQ